MYTAISSVALCLAALVACRPATARQNKVQGPALAADTAGPGARFQARTFTLTNPATRDSLQKTISRERGLWLASGVRDYQVAVRVQCFCPGPQEWLVIEVRKGSAQSVRTTTGRAVALTQDNNYSIDRLFEVLQQNALRDDVVEVAFDPVAHFPAYIRIDMRLGLPDDWGIFDVRGFRASR